MRSIKLLNCVFSYIIIALALSACSGASGTSPADNSANVSVSNTNPGDISPPTTPGNLRIAAGSTTSSSIQLLWDASTDNTGVAGYRIMRNASLITTTTSTTFTDTSLQPDTGYQYSIIAFDAANNTAATNALTVTTLNNADTTSPTTPANLRSSSITSSSIQLLWDASTDNTGVAGYRIMRNASLIATTTSTTFTDTSLQPDTGYQYSIIAFDAANNTAATNALTITTLSISNTGAATLNWTPPTENTDDSVLTDLSGYKIYYGVSPDALNNSIIINNPGLTTYVIENLNANTTYYFAITAINSTNTESVYSNTASKLTSG